MKEIEERKKNLREEENVNVEKKDGKQMRGSKNHIKCKGDK